MKKLFYIFLLISFGGFAQLRKEYSTPKFAYPPLFLFKINPTSLFAVDNTFMFGGEFAPPIGKFSFNFDYGIGKGKNNFRKVIRDNLPDDKFKEMRFELRTYFSDWFFFHQFDMKPFGRYYALEYGMKEVQSFPEAIIYKGNEDSPRYYEFLKTKSIRKEQTYSVKLGRHIIFSRWLMLDIYGGVGVLHYKVTGEEGLDNQVLFYNVTRSRRDWQPGDKGFLPHFTAGIRTVLPLF